MEPTKQQKEDSAAVKADMNKQAAKIDNLIEEEMTKGVSKPPKDSTKKL